MLFVGCNKDSEQFIYLFFLQKTHRIISSLHFTACVFNNRCVSSVLFQLFFSHHSWRNPWSPFACSTNINSARALLLAAEVTRVFFSSTLFPAHTFLILILQTASYTHACWLTLISGGCGVLRSIRVLHTKLKRPGTRSNRLRPDPDPGLGSSVKTSSN